MSRVLIVDDEVLVGQALARSLKREHDVEFVTSAEAALALFEKDAGYDVVLCDVHMPGMSGPELFELLEGQRPDLAQRFVFLSGGAVSEPALTTLERIQNIKLSKPVDTDGCSAAIAQAVQYSHGLAR